MMSRVSFRSIQNSCRAALGLIALCAAFTCLSPSILRAQSIGSGSIRPFVTGLVPVIGRGGAVGGVSVDAKGVLRLATAETTARFRAACEKELRDVPADLRKPSSLRKVSLRQIDEALAQFQKDGKPLPQEIQFLGGLTRVEMVFVDEERRDIVIAGPAESWRVGADGEVVGAESGRPIVRLQDLLVALRIAADGGEPATCSIDPNKRRLADLQRTLANPRLRAGGGLKRQLERSLGPQEITFQGVESNTRFAHVMLAADFQMKRLAMQLDPSAPARPRGYLDMLKAAGRRPKNAAPRWWLEPHYTAILRDPDGLAWRLAGPGVQAKTENAHLRADGSVEATGDEEEIAAKWAQSFNSEFESLSRRYTALADLRNCMDLAVVAAILWSENLLLKADLELPHLLDSQDIQPPRLATPKTVASQASLVRSGRDFIVAVSGGVEVDGWAIVEQAAEDAKLSSIRTQALGGRRKRWLWD